MAARLGGAAQRCVVRAVEDFVELTFMWRNGETIGARRPSAESVEKTLHRLALTLTKRLTALEGNAKKKARRGAAVPTFAVSIESVEMTKETTNWEAFVDGAVLRVQQLAVDAPDGSSEPAAGDVVPNATAYTCVRNPPAVLSLHVPSTVFTGVPVAVTSALEFANSDDAQWIVTRNHHTVYKARARDLVFCPDPDLVGEVLQVVCTPCRGDTVGDAVEATLPAIQQLPPRPWINPSIPAGWQSIVSWNVLADAYTRQPEIFPYVEPPFLRKDYRGHLVIDELRTYDAAVCCLQEVDLTSFDRSFQPVMAELGYTGTFAVKGGADGVEGCAIFAKNSAFRIVTEQSLVLSKAYDDPQFTDLFGPYATWTEQAEIFRMVSTVCQLVHLESADAEKTPLIVLNTHLYYHPRAPHVRSIHMAVILRWASKIRAAVAPGAPIILAGDLNSTPETGVIEFLLTGRLSQHHPEWARGPRMRWTDGKEAELDGVPEEEVTAEGQRRGNLPVLWNQPGGVCHGPLDCPGPDLMHDLGFVSPISLEDMSANSSNYTAGFCGWLDYILCSGPIEVELAQDVIDEAVLRKDTALPSQGFPSDHIPVVARVRLSSPK